MLVVIISSSSSIPQLLAVVVVVVVVLLHYCYSSRLLPRRLAAGRVASSHLFEPGCFEAGLREWVEDGRYLVWGWLLYHFPGFSCAFGLLALLV